MRERDPQLAWFAAVGRRLPSGNHPMRLILPGGDGQHARTLASAAARRHDPIRQQLQNPAPCAEILNPPGTQRGQNARLAHLLASRVGASGSNAPYVRFQVHSTQEEQNEQAKSEQADLTPEGTTRARAPVSHPDSSNAEPHRVGLDTKTPGEKHDARCSMHRREDAEHRQSAPNEPWEQAPPSQPHGRANAHQQTENNRRRNPPSTPKRRRASARIGRVARRRNAPARCPGCVIS